MTIATFPLPKQVLPVMKFGADQTADFAKCRDRLLHATMDARHEFRERYVGKLDPRVWKVLKKRSRHADAFTVYIPKRKAQIPRPSSTRSCSPILIGAGAVHGSLHDVMLGVTGSTTGAMRFVASYMHKDVLDGRVLSTLQTPTEHDPFEHLGIKWMVKGPSFAMKKVIRPRDFVVLESTGVRTDEATGVAVGHLIMHSVELRGCRSLRSQFGIVRGALSFCFLFSENAQTPGKMDVFFKGFVDPRGGVTERIALGAAAESIMACQNASLCARMKKYSWMVREMRDRHGSSARNTAGNREPAPLASGEGVQDEEEKDQVEEDGRCSVCDVGFSAFTVSLRCDICAFNVCSACAQTVVMGTSLCSSVSADQEHIHFCHHCVHAVDHLDPLRAAKDDASHTLRALRRLSMVSNTVNAGDGAAHCERIKLVPLKKRCQSVVGMQPSQSLRSDLVACEKSEIQDRTRQIGSQH